MDNDTSVGHSQSASPLTVTIIALGPREGRMPWWAKRAKLDYSHIVLALGDCLWDQPIDGVGRACPREPWLINAMGTSEREVQFFSLTVEDHDPWAWLAMSKIVEGKRGQKWRTALRYLHLWPRPAWNCTSPVRCFLAALRVPVKGETPDAIIAELIEGASAD